MPIKIFKSNSLTALHGAYFLTCFNFYPVHKPRSQGAPSGVSYIGMLCELSLNCLRGDYNSYIYKAMVQVVEALNVEAILKVFNTEGR